MRETHKTHANGRAGAPTEHIANFVAFLDVHRRNGGTRAWRVSLFRESLSSREMTTISNFQIDSRERRFTSTKRTRRR